jgi:type 1 glutamine amidotransferase
MPRILILGGLTTDYHNFDVLGPVIARVATDAGFEVETTTEMRVLNLTTLNTFDGLINYTTDRDISPDQWAALRDYVRGGGGYIGIHNATDTFENEPEALRLIGGHFITHPAQLDVAVDIVDTSHAVTEGVEPFTVRDELYIMETWPETYRLLASTNAEGGQPISWVRDEGDGRVFYLSLGHNPEVYGNPQYRKLLTQGIRWATGER